MRKKLWSFSYFLLPVVWMLVIFWFSNQAVLPGSEIFWQDFLLKKGAHICVYMILFWSWWLAFRQNQLTSKKSLVFILLFCLIYAMLDEWHQSFIPGRTATARDVGFDLLGVILATAWTYRVI